jgi:hypothetical protein
MPVPTQATASTTQTLASSGSIQSIPQNNSTIKSGSVQICSLKVGHPYYASNWAQVLHDLGINTLRLEAGSGGDSWKTNMVDNAASDAWAYNLDSLLSTVANAGFKCYFQSLGDPFSGGIFGIDDLNLSPFEPRYPSLTSPNNHSGWTYSSTYNTYSTPISLNVAKGYVDKLAGNNSLGHNFLTDPRIIAWTIGNECYIGTKNSNGSITTNSIYAWITGLADYMRSKGAKVIANCPIIDATPNNGDSWDQDFIDTVPLFQNHADYIEYHQYGLNELVRPNNGVNQFALGNPATGCDYNWAAWSTWMQNVYAWQMANRGGFAADHVIAGEFGIWHGYDTEGPKVATFSDQNCRDYYNYYFRALNAAGLKWMSFYAAFKTIRWGMISNTNPAVELAGCESIKAYYAG